MRIAVLPCALPAIPLRERQETLHQFKVSTADRRIRDMLGDAALLVRDAGWMRAVTGRMGGVAAKVAPGHSARLSQRGHEMRRMMVTSSGSGFTARLRSSGPACVPRI